MHELSSSGLEFVPTLYSRKNLPKWYNIKANFDAHPPKAVLGFNEPDLSSQGDMNPYDAAALYMQEIFPLKKKYGTRLVSPQIAWRLDWMDTFLKELHNRGGYVDGRCFVRAVALLRALNACLCSRRRAPLRLVAGHWQAAVRGQCRVQSVSAGRAELPSEEES